MCSESPVLKCHLEPLLKYHSDPLFIFVSMCLVYTAVILLEIGDLRNDCRQCISNV